MVEDVQHQWADGIVKIGRLYSEGGDYINAAKEHIKKLYAYDISAVLFKPTRVSRHQFRPEFDDALSYFVGGKYAEDTGFAINPWRAVRFENDSIVAYKDNVYAMGNYYFTPPEGDEVKVEFTFCYIRDEEGRLRINLHHSSLPFQG